MIKDKIKNAQIYYGISEKLKKGFEWILKQDFTNVNDGRDEISDGMYANIESYDTKEYALYEAHKKYIDIQYIIKGYENIGVCDLDACSENTVYNEENDITFYNYGFKDDYHLLKTGEFMVFFPTDAHKPSINRNGVQKVRKVVVKVPVN